MHWGFYVTGAGVGLLIGAFLNVVVYRGPHIWGLVDDAAPRGSLAAPRSYCPACRSPIDYWRLAPIVSFFAQRGKCASCEARIPWRYPIVEALGAAVAVAALWRFGVSFEAALAAVFGWTLIALAAIDFETRYLPDALSLPLIAGGVAFNTVDLFAPLPDAVFGAAVGYGVFWAIGRAYAALRGKEGLGLGDAKLLSAIGAWAGWTALPMTVLFGALASLAGAALAAALNGSGRLSAQTEAPFGPGLALAGFIVFLLS